MVAEKDTIRRTHRPRCVNPSPDVRFPTHESHSRRSPCPDVRFPTREPLPTFVFRRMNPTPDVHLAPTYVFRRVNPLPTFVFPTRELAPTCVSRCVNLSRRSFFRRVNPSPDVPFPMRETFETVSICDRSSYWSFNAFSQHVKCSDMRSRLVKHSDVPRRVRTSMHFQK